MRELVTEIPDPQHLLALEPEELAGILLSVFRQHGRMVHPGGWDGDLFADRNATPAYPPHLRPEILQAIAEAWAWLEAQGLLVPADSANGPSGWRVLSRRARRMATKTDFTNFRVARLITREGLHRTIADRVWASFIRGEYDGAILHAMRAVEIAVRAGAGYGNDRYGVQLMRDAFHPENGPLTDMESEPSERNGRKELFSGAIATYKNPPSHRDIDLDNPAEAAEIIMLANHLLRIIDARVAARQA